MFGDHEYAVFDVETTGFSPAKHDRIIEIGIVRIDGHNNTISEYSTLVNPNRDVGPSHIHGITARDVVDAPRFDEVVGDVLAAIKGAVLVAHNVGFDLRFLAHECAQCGAPLPSIMSLCTLSLSRSIGPDVPSRRLSVLCDHFGIELSNAHSALEDARATAALLTTYLDELRDIPGKSALKDVGAKGRFADLADWPAIAPSQQQYRRTDAMLRQKQSVGRLNRIFNALPPQNSTNNAVDEYLDLLERALEDRHISKEEIVALQEMAQSLDMDQEEVRQAHRVFLKDIIRLAWSDEVITEEERKDIETVADLLGIPPEEYRSMVDQLENQAGSPAVPAAGPNANLTHRQICFTGTFNSLVNGERVTRGMMEEIAISHGMIVKKTVTKSLDCLVCADPNTMSGKAKKAREYGVRIIAEPAFFKMISG